MLNFIEKILVILTKALSKEIDKDRKLQQANTTLIKEIHDQNYKLSAHERRCRKLRNSIVGLTK